MGNTPLMSNADFIVECKGGAPAHFNGTIGIENFDYTFTNGLSQFVISNTDASDNLLVSFDGGTNFFTISSSSSLSMDDVGVTSMRISGSAAGVTYEILAVE